MVDAEQIIGTLLDRIEHNARHADKAWRRNMDLRAEVKELRRVLDISREGNRLGHRDMTAATNKIKEWEEYAALLRRAIDPKSARAKRVVVPAPPGPFETEVPF